MILRSCDFPDNRALSRRARALAGNGSGKLTLRYRSPVQAAFRVTTRDLELYGHSIPARSLVLAMIGSANRDPRHFADAERLDVGREPNPHLAFGHGIHFCVGAPLARLEARVALPMLLDHLGEFASAADELWEPREAFHVHGPSRLRLRFRPLRCALAADGV